MFDALGKQFSDLCLLRLPERERADLVRVEDIVLIKYKVIISFGLYLDATASLAAAPSVSHLSFVLISCPR